MDASLLVEFGNRLRKVRESEKLTLDEVTQGICPPLYLSQVEAGAEKELNLQILTRISERLNRDLNRLLGASLYNKLIQQKHEGQWIGSKFRKYRLERGMTQAEVSEGICSHQMVSLLESDRHYPAPQTLQALAERLGIPFAELIPETFLFGDLTFEFDLIQIYVNLREYQRALHHLEILKRRSISEVQKLRLLILQANCLRQTGRNQEAIALLLPFIQSQEANQTLDDETLCEAYNSLGNAHLQGKDFQMAFSAFDNGCRISQRLPEFEHISAKLANNRGLVCLYLNQKEEANQYLQKAYKYYESVSDMKSLAETLHSLALANGCEKTLTKALFLYESLNLVHEANRVRQHFAFQIESTRDMTKALDALEKTSLEFERLEDPVGCFYTLARASILCSKRGDLDRALFYLKRAEQYHAVRHREDLHFLSPEFYAAKALYSLHTEQFEECIRNAREASTICANMNLQIEASKHLQVSAKALFLQGKETEAYHELEQALKYQQQMEEFV